MNILKLSFSQAIIYLIMKVSSGRFILTILAGVGLLMMEGAIIDVLKMKVAEEGGITATEILAFATTIFVVIQSVFMSYFAKRRDWEDETDRTAERDSDNPDEK